MTKTLFDITKEMGHGIPFAVRQQSWPDDIYMIIFYVGSHKMTNNKKQNAFGIPFFRDKQIKLNYLIENADKPVWEQIANRNLPLLETDKILKLHTALYSGKYTGHTMLDIVELDIQYIKDIIDDSKYAIDESIFDFLNTLGYNLFPIDYINRNQRRLEMIRHSQINTITLKSENFDNANEDFASENGSPIGSFDDYFFNRYKRRVNKK